MMQKQWWVQLLALQYELRKWHQTVLVDVAFLISLDSEKKPDSLNSVLNEAVKVFLILYLDLWVPVF